MNRVKWAALMVALIVAGAVAGFAIYTWGWRDVNHNNVGRAEESALAHAAAHELLALCDPDCDMLSLARVAPAIWKLEERDSEGVHNCIAIHVDEFRPLSHGQLTGAALR